jgi:hypothetical protein
MSTTNLPIKDDESCSNVFLIDERLCLSESFPIINVNIDQLKNNLSIIESYGRQWNNLFSLFTGSSARWIQSSLNVYKTSGVWVDMYNTVKTLSANWTKEFSLYYPTVLEINNWYNQSEGTQDSIIKPWLNSNFPATDYTSEQTISLYISLYQELPFQYRFNRSMYEPCTPQGGGITLSCSVCPTPYRGCNHHGGKAGYGPCTNAYDACHATTSSSGMASYSCVPSSGIKTLNIAKYRTYTDTSIARIIRIRYRRYNNAWIRIT